MCLTLYRYGSVMDWLTDLPTINHINASHITSTELCLPSPSPPAPIHTKWSSYWSCAENTDTCRLRVSWSDSARVSSVLMSGCIAISIFHCQSDVALILSLLKYHLLPSTSLSFKTCSPTSANENIPIRTPHIYPTTVFTIVGAIGCSSHRREFLFVDLATAAWSWRWWTVQHQYQYRHHEDYKLW